MTDTVKAVRVGQTWRHKRKGNKYVVMAVGKMRPFEPHWIDSVTYFDEKTNEVYTRALEDFCAKFQKVGLDDE